MKVPAELARLIVDVVVAILGSSDPKGAARRAEEAARRRVLVETIKKARKKI